MRPIFLNQTVLTAVITLSIVAGGTGLKASTQFQHYNSSKQQTVKKLNFLEDSDYSSSNGPHEHKGDDSGFSHPRPQDDRQSHRHSSECSHVSHVDSIKDVFMPGFPGFSETLPGNEINAFPTESFTISLAHTTPLKKQAPDYYTSSVVRRKSETPYSAESIAFVGFSSSLLFDELLINKA